ncbi:MAG: hypothetical protein ACREJU_00980, partial [Nitrospiraceae bacterium]
MGILLGLTLILTGILLESSLFAQSQVIFGPTQYLRTAGPPNQYTDTFTVTHPVGAPFQLHIVNGNPDGTNRVSSGRVTLNGIEIVGPSDFGQTVPVIDRPVTLVASNTVEIRLTSAPGSFITLSILGTNVVPTALTPNPLILDAGTTGTLTATLAPAP